MSAWKAVAAATLRPGNVIDHAGKTVAVKGIKIERPRGAAAPHVVVWTEAGTLIVPTGETVEVFR